MGHQRRQSKRLTSPKRTVVHFGGKSSLSRCRNQATVPDETPKQLLIVIFLITVTPPPQNNITTQPRTQSLVIDQLERVLGEHGDNAV